VNEKFGLERESALICRGAEPELVSCRVCEPVWPTTTPLKLRELAERERELPCTGEAAT
jgi:hypothetical protein